ncbi:MAG: hypothetical protein M1820_000050 [Bogoriella megaspora]|nr:MAG: hypothetical protein M1820_000050 [Bogoriella megaspora]
MDKKAAIGTLSCKVCGQTFQMAINYLSVPIDVYSEWIDACDAVAKETATGGQRPIQEQYRGTMGRRSAVDDGDELGYGGEGIVADDVDAEADYDDE